MKKLWISLGIILGIFVLLHFLLEPIVENVVNKKLDRLEGYRGSIEDVDIQLFRGAYRIHGIDIRDRKDTLNPFVQVNTLDLSVQWKALFEGKIVGEVIINRPVINYTAESPEDEVKSDTAEANNWTEKLQELMPLTINRLEVQQGSVTYRDQSSELELDTYLKSLNVLVQNISNVKDSASELPTSLSASAITLGAGKLDIEMDLNLLKNIPEFSANIKMDSLELAALNQVFRAYANVDVQKGIFSMISEMNVDNGQLDGYIKPFFENLEVFSYQEDVREEKEKGFFGKIWEALVGIGSEVIENQPKERVASQIPIKGNLEKMEPDVAVAIWSVFTNAFIQVIEKEFEVVSQGKDVQQP